MPCKKHPLYRGLKKPATNCAECRAIYKNGVPHPERVLALLKKPGARLKFKHIVAETKLSSQEVEKAISDLRVTHPNLTFAKFDKTFYLSDTPAWYSLHTDLSQVLPCEGEIGIISDTHLGSIADRLDLLNEVYDEFRRRGITTVLHQGDLTDGFCEYRGHHQFVKVYGSQPQAAYAIEHYPRRPAIKTYVIAGNHDLDSYRNDRVDRLSLIVKGFYHEGRWVEGRDDIVYCGHFSHNYVLPQQVVIHALHPRGNAPYALSYKQQKRSEAMDRNLRPDLQLSGHYHSFNFVWLQGSYFLACPGLQDETEYFKRLGLPRSVGFCFLRYEIKDGQLKSLSPELHMFS